MASSQEKERAVQAMAEAEDRFQSDDLSGAIHLAQRAHGLCPSFHLASNLLVALRVLRTAARHQSEKQRRSAAFWHAILGSRPTDTVEALKRHYRRLCIQIHPDKNPSAAADGAFKLVAQAFEILSAKNAKNSNAKGKAAGAGGSSSKASGSTPHAPRGPWYDQESNKAGSIPRKEGQRRAAAASNQAQGTCYDCGSAKIFVSSSSRTHVRAYVDANGVHRIVIS